MVFLMPGEKAPAAAEPAAKKRPGSLTPREIVAELDKLHHRAEARQEAPWPSRCATAGGGSSWTRGCAREILPKNILMIGPTGVGKTEIARRLARLADAPFIKVEAIQVHRGRLRRPRRRVHRPRPDRGRRPDGARGEDRRDRREAARAARTWTARCVDRRAAPAHAVAPGRSWRRKETRAKRRARAGGCATGKLEDRDGGDRGRRRSVPIVRDRARTGRRGDGHQPQGDARPASSAARRSAAR